MHGSINGRAGRYTFFAWDGGSLVNSPVGLAGFNALAVLGIEVIAFDPTCRLRFVTHTTDPIPESPTPDRRSVLRRP